MLLNVICTLLFTLWPVSLSQRACHEPENNTNNTPNANDKRTTTTTNSNNNTTTNTHHNHNHNNVDHNKHSFL